MTKLRATRAEKKNPNPGLGREKEIRSNLNEFYKLFDGFEATATEFLRTSSQHVVQRSNYKTAHASERSRMSCVSCSPQFCLNEH